MSEMAVISSLMSLRIVDKIVSISTTLKALVEIRSLTWVRRSVGGGRWSGLAKRLCVDRILT